MHRPDLLGDAGMVASTHWLASMAGWDALADGGTAADAAAVAGFVLYVAEPHLNGPGGEVPILLAQAGSEQVSVICGQGVAPAAATPAAFAALGLDAVPGTGYLAACVPGAFDAWMLLLRDHGRLPLRRILEPAIAAAERGTPLLARAAAAIAAVERTFREAWPSSAAQWLPAGRLPVTGDAVPMPGLAATWRRVLAEAEAVGADRVAQLEAARRAWREGFVAEAIADAVRRPAPDATGIPHAGLLAAGDLVAWSATYEPAVTGQWGPVTVAKAGPWTQGPALLQWLALLGDPADLAAGIDGDRADDSLVHRVVETAKLAFADRDAWLGYPAYGDVPLRDLLDPGYVEQRRGLVTAEASLQLRPGSPGGRMPAPVPTREATGDGTSPAGIGEPTVDRYGATRGDTVHVDVVDRWGLMVSATPSGGWLQSSPVIEALGFPLGTRAQMFWLAPGLPSTLRPGARPRTTLSPTIVVRDGEPVLALGTPGGDQQEQWQLVALLHHLAAGRSLQASVDAPGWHSTAFASSFAPREWAPGELVVEAVLGDDVIAALAARGHRIRVAPPRTLGRVTGVGRDPATGRLNGAATSRWDQCYVVGR